MARSSQRRRNGSLAQVQAGTRPTQPSRNITGPQSALTDFLASHNISARQIRDDAERRRIEATAAQAQQTETTAGRSTNTQASARKKKAELDPEPSELEQIKASKAFKKRKKQAPDSDDDDDIARAIFDARNAPLPGQIENCAICGKRFTVTPYSPAGPQGGLLCPPCGKEFAKEKQGWAKQKKPRRQAGGIGMRRAVQSRILDGDVGVKTLSTLCVNTLAKNVDLAASLGDLPDHLLDKIARLFSKRRLLTPGTLRLFARPTTETLHIYDGARLTDQDFITIFQVATCLRRFKARSAIQFKDEVMDYLLSRSIALESFSLHGANLLSEAKWHDFLRLKGPNLKSLQVYYTDRHFGDETMTIIAEHCRQLVRLKVEHNQKLTDNSFQAIGRLSSLEHLSLQMQNHVSPEAIKSLLAKIGPRLKTLSLRMVSDADDSVLEAMHLHCRSLSKLRITDSQSMTDQGFVHLFRDWKNPPLQLLDLQKCRHIDSTRPRSNESSVGLCSDAFRALMSHSGHKLERLNLHACRHISREAFEDVFGQSHQYPELKLLEISFCEAVTDYILGCIFRACPNLKEANVFGCMKVRDVRVPRGVILVGVPNAQGMITEATE